MTVWRWLNNNVKPQPRQSNDIDQLFKKYVDMRDVVLELKKSFCDPLSEFRDNPKLNEKFFLDMTYHSNAIEGSRLTIKETEQALAGEMVKGKEMFEIFEAVNHKNAMRYMFETITPNFKITENYVLKLHEIIMYNFNNNLPGKYRTGYVNLTNSDVVLPSAQEVPTRMSKFILEINKNSSDLITKNCS